MEIGIDAEKDTLQSLIRSCLLELNSLKLELTKRLLINMIEKKVNVE